MLRSLILSTGDTTKPKSVLTYRRVDHEHLIIDRQDGRSGYSSCPHVPQSRLVSATEPRISLGLGSSIQRLMTPHRELVDTVRNRLPNDFEIRHMASCSIEEYVGIPSAFEVRHTLKLA